MRTHKCYSTLFNESFGLFPGFFGPFFFVLFCFPTAENTMNIVHIDLSMYASFSWLRVCGVE